MPRPTRHRHSAASPLRPRAAGVAVRRVLAACVLGLAAASSHAADSSGPEPRNGGFGIGEGLGFGSGFFLGQQDPLFSGEAPSLATSVRGPLGLSHPGLGGTGLAGTLSPTRDRYLDGFGREPDAAPNALVGGFRFNQHFSVELGVADLEADERARGGDLLGTPLTADGSSRVGDLSGMAASLTGSLPLSDDFAVFGKAGLFRWEMDAARSPTTIDDPRGGTEFDSGSRRGYQLQLGIGSDWRLGDRFSVGAQWEYLSDLDAAQPTDDHVFTGRFRFEF